MGNREFQEKVRSYNNEANNTTEGINQEAQKHASKVLEAFKKSPIRKEITEEIISVRYFKEGSKFQGEVDELVRKELEKKLIEDIGKQVGQGIANAIMDDINKQPKEQTSIDEKNGEAR